MDLRKEITDRIIAKLEEGAGEWVKPWSGVGINGMPKNYSTGRAYSGVNVLLLWTAAQERGFDRNQWLTFKQAQELGAKVRKGAKGVMCIFYSMVERKGRGSDIDADEAGKPMPVLKPFWVFNVAEIDGLPAAAEPTTKEEFTPIEAAERLLKDSGAMIRHGGNRAFYSVAGDAIDLPERERFASAEDYYATALHELTHWTGHHSRLNREFGKRFGDAAYAFEELVAELGSAFVMGELGLMGTMDGHASYLQAWLQVLKADKTAIFTAAKHASAAYSAILRTDGGQPQATA